MGRELQCVRRPAEEYTVSVDASQRETDERNRRGEITQRRKSTQSARLLLASYQLTSVQRVHGLFGGSGIDLNSFRLSGHEERGSIHAAA